jgi:hypothetical protein
MMDQLMLGMMDQLQVEAAQSDDPDPANAEGWL